MRPADYTNEAIIEAGNSIQAMGKNVTKYGLSAMVGGGDPKRLLAVWQAHELRIAEVAQKIQELPVSIAKELDLASAAIFTHLRTITSSLQCSAMEAAELRITQIRDNTDQELEQAKQEQADAEVVIEQLGTKLESAQVQIDDLTSRLEIAHDMREKSSIELVRLRDQVAKYSIDEKMADIELRVEKDRVEGLTKERDLALASEIKLGTELSLVNDQLLTLRHERQTARDAEIELRGALGEAKGKADALGKQVTELMLVVRSEQTKSD